MEKPSIGDETSIANSTLQGKIKGLDAKGWYLVELEDGFEIPVHPDHIILKRKPKQTEKEVIVPKSIPAIAKDISGAKQGHYIGFTIDEATKGKNIISARFINTTAQPIFFSVYNFEKSQYLLLSEGKLNSSSIIEVGTVSIEEIEKWKVWYINILSVPGKSTEPPLPLALTIKIKEANILKSEQSIPFSTQKGWLVSLSNLSQKQDKNITGQEVVFHKDEDKSSIITIRNVGDIVDLHIDELPGGKGLTGPEALQKQSEFFLNTIEKAYSFGLPKIIFIHGIGNGVLKKHIRELMAEMNFVEKFVNADYAKYGAGATEVTFKSK